MATPQLELSKEDWGLLREAAPNWADVLAMDDLFEQMRATMSDPNKDMYWRINWGPRIYLRKARWCLVGECHGFSGDYVRTCRQCWDLGCHIYRRAINQGPQTLVETVPAFLQHWRKCGHRKPA